MSTKAPRQNCFYVCLPAKNQGWFLNTIDDLELAFPDRLELMTSGERQVGRHFYVCVEYTITKPDKDLPRFLRDRMIRLIQRSGAEEISQTEYYAALNKPTVSQRAMQFVTDRLSRKN